MNQARRAPTEHTHASHGRSARLARDLAGGARWILVAARFRAQSLSRFYIGPRVRLDIGPQADVSIGRGVVMVSDFTGSFQGHVSIGRGVWFARGCTLSAHMSLDVGDGTVLGEYASIHDNGHQVQAPEITLEDRRYVVSPVTIGERVWIGAKATILPGVSVGDDAVIAAGAVVSRDVAARTTVGGVPARLLST